MSGDVDAPQQLRRRRASAATDAAATAARRARSPAPEAMSWSAAYKACAFDRLLCCAGFLLHTVTQVMTLLAWKTLPDWERFQRVLSCVVAAAMWLLPTALPRLYLRRRALLLGAYRLVFFAFPLLRKKAGIQRVLDAPPSPGVRGALGDLYRVVWGTRLIAVLTATLLNPLPLLPLVPHLALQAYSVAMVRSNESLCGTPLLSHPATSGRIAAFHATMQLVSMALPGGVGQCMFSVLQRSRDLRVAQCESFLSFVTFTVGLLLPMAILVLTEPPSSLRAWEAKQAAAAARTKRGLAGALARAEAVVEGAVRQLCGRSWLAPAAGGEEDEERELALLLLPADGGPHGSGGRNLLRLRLQGWERGLVWWLLLALVWALSVAAATEGAL